MNECIQLPAHQDILVSFDVLKMTRKVSNSLSAIPCWTFGILAYGIFWIEFASTDVSFITFLLQCSEQTNYTSSQGITPPCFPVRWLSRIHDGSWIMISFVNEAAAILFFPPFFLIHIFIVKTSYAIPRMNS